MGVFSPRLREYFSLTYEQWGTMSGLGSLGQTVSLLLVGWVIARFGVRRITELSLGGVGACFVLIGQGANLLALKISLFFQGLFGGFFQVIPPRLPGGSLSVTQTADDFAPVDLRFRHGHRDSAVG